MDKPLDVAQLCPECGAVLDWTESREHTEARPSYNARCSCFWEVFDMAAPARNLTVTEKLLLTRIAELEEARRWRVTAEELPPVGEEVLSRFANKPHVYIWQPSGHERIVGPVLWMPIPGVPHE